jgi:hypothetical protein
VDDCNKCHRNRLARCTTRTGGWTHLRAVVRAARASQISLCRCICWCRTPRVGPRVHAPGDDAAASQADRGPYRATARERRCGKRSGNTALETLIEQARVSSSTSYRPPKCHPSTEQLRGGHGELLSRAHEAGLAGTRAAVLIRQSMPEALTDLRVGRSAFGRSTMRPPLPSGCIPRRKFCPCPVAGHVVQRGQDVVFQGQNAGGLHQPGRGIFLEQRRGSDVAPHYRHGAVAVLRHDRRSDFPDFAAAVARPARWARRAYSSRRARVRVRRDRRWQRRWTVTFH